MDYFHQPVLLNEVISGLNLKSNQNVIDGTLGGGGHALEVLKKIGPHGLLLGLDRDPRAIFYAKKRLNQFKDRIIILQTSYKNINKIIYEQRLNLQFHHLYLDLGLSSAQLSPEETRGFSFQSSSNLDMRFGPDSFLTAKEILNHWSEEKLYRLFKDYGEERYAKLIARNIVSYRKAKPLETTDELTNIIEDSYRGRRGHLHPATKVFQALRIAVNDELNSLTEFLPEALKVISTGGRIAVISYHSLEDRIVKNFFRQESTDCLCPKDFPVCRCDHQASVKLITKKPITPKPTELQSNPRSRSAKLRIAEKI